MSDRGEDAASRESVRELYASSDAFVLPTRGEGWGLPIAEAMSMGLPVIATNHSGPTAYLTESNSYPIPIDTLLPNGHGEPSLSVLRKQMRRVFTQREEAQERGRRARTDLSAVSYTHLTLPTILLV